MTHERCQCPACWKPGEEGAAAPNVILMPHFKPGATPEERFLELAQVAAKNPADFKTFIVAWEPATSTGKERAFILSHEMTAMSAVGFLYFVMDDIISGEEK